MNISNPTLQLIYLEDSTTTTIDGTYIVKGSIVFSEQLLKELESSSNKVSLSIHQDCPAILHSSMSLLKTNNDVKAILRDGDTVLFTGYVSESLSWAVDSVGEQSLNITLEDVGTRLLPKPYKKTGGKEYKEEIASVVIRDIAAKAGIEVDPTFPVINTRVARVIKVGDKCQDLLKSLCLEVGYAYYFTREGKLNAKKIDCTSTSGIPVLDKESLYMYNNRGLQLSKKIRQYKNSKITFKSTKVRYRSGSEGLIYKDISGQDDNHPDCNIEIPYGGYYPAEDGTVSYVDATDIDNGCEILSISNLQPEVTWSRGSGTSEISIFGADSISVRLRCTNAGGYDKGIVSKLQAKADFVYVDAENIVYGGETVEDDQSDNTYEVECQWIREKADADKLANLVVSFYKYCSKQFVFYSTEDYECGDIIKIFDDQFSGLSVNVIVFAKKYDDQIGLITYQAYSISEFKLSEPTISTKTYVPPSKTNSTPASGVNYYFDINLSRGIYKRNSRKASLQQITITGSIQGYSETTITLSTDHGSFSPDSEVTSYNIMPSVPEQSTATLYIPYNNTYDTITISGVLNADTYTYKTISAVNETALYQYLGALTSLPAPSNYGYDEFAIGDHFFCAKNFIDSNITYEVGNAYCWTGSVWTMAMAAIATEDGGSLGIDYYTTVMSNCLNDAVDVDVGNNTQLGSWMKRLAGHEIIADTIMTKELTMTSTGSLKSAQYEEEEGFPTKGYKLTSNDGTLRAMNAMLRDVNIKCTDSQNKILLQTQRYQAGQSGIAVRDGSKAARWCIDDAESVFTTRMQDCSFNGQSRKAYRAQNMLYTSGYRYLIGDYNISSGGGSKEGFRYGCCLCTVPLNGFYYAEIEGARNPQVMPGLKLKDRNVISFDNIGTAKVDLGYLEADSQFLAISCGSVKLYLYNTERQYEICTTKSESFYFSGSWNGYNASGSQGPSATFTGTTYMPEIWISEHAYISLSFTKDTFNSNDNKNYYAISPAIASWSSGYYTSTDSSVTGDDQTLSVVNIGKSESVVNFRDASYNTISVSLPVDTNDIAYSGWYKNLNGTINLVGQESGLLTYNVLPSINQRCSLGTGGQAWLEVVSYGFNSLSSRSEKKDIKKYEESASDIINDTEIVSFKYKDDERNIPKVGFIADDTNSLMSGPDHNKFDLNNCVGLLLKAFQELSARIDKLESTNGSKL